jgi:uncharacterized phiE125 gp8 family phage protein
MTAIRRTVAPTEDPITLTEAKAHLRVLHSDDDTYIAGLVSAAVALVDGEGMLGRAMVTQTWAQWVDQAPGWVRLTMGPFIALTSVQYYDDTGTLQTATLADYETRLHGDFVICKPKEGYEWPSADAREDAIKITYTAGFGAASAVPAGLKHALLMLVAHWYANREASSAEPLKDVPMAVEHLIGAERVTWYG